MTEENNLPPLIISVDPGANGGWALWRNGEYQESGIMNGDHVHPIYRLIGSLHKDEPEGRRLLVIEDQYVMIGGKKGNWNTAKVLITRRARWQTIAELFGWEVVLMNPRSWQSKVLKRMPGCDTKAKSVFLATQITGKTPASDDLADAVCIGECWIREARLPVQKGLAFSKGKNPKRPQRRARKR